MYYAIDIILLAVLVIMVIRGQRKGFVRMLLEFIGTIVSIVLAWFVSMRYSSVVYNSYFKEGVIRSIDGRLSGSDSLDSATASFYSIPNQLRGIASLLGFDVDGISKTVDANSADGAQKLESAVVGPIVTVIIRILMFIAVIVVVSIIFKFIIGMINRATKLPTIKKADGFLGAVLGFVSGVIAVILLAEIIFAVSGMIDNEIIAEKVSSSITIKIVRQASSYLISLF